MRNILICIPPFQDQVYLPYVAGLLQAHCDTYPDLKENFQWLEPLFLPGTPATLLEMGPDPTQVHILGLSCYDWSWDANMEIARLVKQAHPECLIVAGGPGVPLRRSDLFQTYPALDLVVIEDGELPFAQVLQESLKSVPHYENISGLLLNRKGHAIRTGPSQKIMNFGLESPYLDSQLMNQVAKKFGKLKWTKALWETNRGCPYKCRFCDWGSNTYSKIRQIPMERLRQEMLWFCENNVNAVFIADANFGILERDLEITDRLIQCSRGTQISEVYWAPTKNKADRIYEIGKKLYDASLLATIVVGIQSTNPHTLEAMERMNLSSGKYLDLIKRLQKDQVSTTGVLIMACPGESLQDYKKSIIDLVDMGFHEEIRCHMYTLLPNAPSADPEYVKEHGIKTKLRSMTTQRCLRQVGTRPFAGRARVITEHNLLSEEDWLEMVLYSSLIMSHHNFALTRFLAIYFSATERMTYREFYDSLFEYYKNSSGWMNKKYRQLESHYRRFLDDPQALYVLDPELDEYLYEPEEWWFIQAAMEYEAFSGDLKQFSHLYLTPKETDQELLQDLLRYQREICIDPGYDRRRGKTFVCHYDWPAYFYPLLHSKPQVPLNRGLFQIEVGDQKNSFGMYRKDLDWSEIPDGSQKAKLARFAQQTVSPCYIRNASTYFTEVRALPI